MFSKEIDKKKAIEYLESLYGEKKMMDMDLLVVGFYKKENMSMNQLTEFLKLLRSVVYDKDFKDFVIYLNEDGYQIHFMITPERHEKMVKHRELQAA